MTKSHLKLIFVMIWEEVGNEGFEIEREWFGGFEVFYLLCQNDMKGVVARMLR